MTFKIGVWAANIGTSGQPRGLQRVAREISLNFKNSPAVEYLAVEAIEFVSGRLIARYSDLGTFLNAFGSTHSRYCDLATFDVILSFECYESIWLLPLRRLGIKTVCVIHDLIPLRIEEHADVDRMRFYTAVSNAADKASLLISVSLSTQLDLLEMFPDVAPRAVVIYNGHGNRILQDNMVLAGTAKCADTQVVTMIGTVERRKNHATVLRALQLIAKERPYRKYRFVAAGDNQADIFGRSHKHLLSEAQEVLAVEFPGFVDDFELAQLYAQSDAVVFSSFWEGFGIPMLEAMAFGVPVVASDLSSMPEVGREHVVYCDPYNVDSVKSALEEILDIPRDQAKSRTALAQKWAAQFDWKHFAADYERCLIKVASGDPSAIAAAYTEQMVQSYLETSS